MKNPHSTLPLTTGVVPVVDHEHAWRTESAHTTSDGRVLYVRCVGCGTRRVDLQQRTDDPPWALSATIGGRVDTRAR